MLADAQNLGGYPVIGVVATVDFAILAQLKPGDSVSFKEISRSSAIKELQKREERLTNLWYG